MPRKPKKYLLHTSDKKSFKPNHIQTILEHHPGARFVEEIACRNTQGNWTPWGAAVFYQPKPPKPEFSKFFAYQWNDAGRLIITGLKKFDPKILAMYEPTEWGAYLTISRFGHDFVMSPLKGRSSFIDGGRDYNRLGGNPIPETVVLNLQTMKFKRKGREYVCTRE